MGKTPVYLHQGPSYESDRVHPSIISLGFLMHRFYGEFAGTVVICHKKRVVISPGTYHWGSTVLYLSCSAVQCSAVNEISQVCSLS